MLFKQYFFCSVLYLFCAALLWCLISHPEGHFDIDSYGYDALGWHAAQTGSFLHPTQPERMPTQPLGYYAFLAVLYTLFGRSHTLVYAIQLLCMLFCLWLIMRLARMLFGQECVFVVGIFAALNLGFIVYPQLLLAETLLLLFTLLSWDRFVVYVRDGSWCALMLSAFLLSVALLVKQLVVGIFFVLLIVLFLLPRTAMQKLYAVLIFTVCYSAPLFLYMARNWLIYGVFALAPMMNVNMQHYLIPQVMQHLGESLALDCADDQGQSVSLVQLFARYPLAVSVVWLKNMCKTMCSLYGTQFKRMVDIHAKNTWSFFAQQGTVFDRFVLYVHGGADSLAIRLIVWFECLYSLIRLFAALFGFWLLITRKSYLLSFALMGIIAVVLLPTGMDGSCRFRVLIEPIMLLLAAVSCVEMKKILFISKKEKRYGIP